MDWDSSSIILRNVSHTGLSNGLSEEPAFRRKGLSRIWRDPGAVRISAEFLSGTDSAARPDGSPDQSDGNYLAQGRCPGSPPEGIHLPGVLGCKSEHLLRHGSLRNRTHVETRRTGARAGRCGPRSLQNCRGRQGPAELLLEVERTLFRNRSQ